MAAISGFSSALQQRWALRPAATAALRPRCSQSGRKNTSVRCTASIDQDVSQPQSTESAGSSCQQETPAAPPSALDSLPQERLKQLRRDGLALKDVIKLGRRGIAEGLAKQIHQRWNTSEVARLHCQGKHAANMKVLVQELEAMTGGIVVHRAGGTVLIYRGDGWQGAEAAAADKQRGGGQPAGDSGPQPQQQEVQEQHAEAQGQQGQ